MSESITLYWLRDARYEHYDSAFQLANGGSARSPEPSHARSACSRVNAHHMHYLQLRAMRRLGGLLLTTAKVGNSAYAAVDSALWPYASGAVVNTHQLAQHEAHSNEANRTCILSAVGIHGCAHGVGLKCDLHYALGTPSRQSWHATANVWPRP